MLYREIIAVCSQTHTKHINTLCEQNVELLNVKLAVLSFLHKYVKRISMVSLFCAFTYVNIGHLKVQQNPNLLFVSGISFLCLKLKKRSNGGCFFQLLTYCLLHSFVLIRALFLAAVLTTKLLWLQLHGNLISQ